MLFAEMASTFLISKCKHWFFFICVIASWVIRRRNVIYLYNKEFHLDQLFHWSKFPDMMSLGELQISFPLFFVPKIHLMTSYPETLTVKKLINIWG
jgi:hypothetical protein